MRTIFRARGEGVFRETGNHPSPVKGERVSLIVVKEG